jgi:hypothetical protein
MDFAAEYSVWTQNNTEFRINLGLLNFTDQENILGRRFRGSLNDAASSPQVSTIDTYSLGFTPNIAFRVNW